MRGWKAEKVGAPQVAPMMSQEPQAGYAQPAAPAPFAAPVGDESDDLPF